MEEIRESTRKEGPRVPFGTDRVPLFALAPHAMQVFLREVTRRVRPDGEIWHDIRGSAPGRFALGPGSPWRKVWVWGVWIESKDFPMPPIQYSDRVILSGSVKPDLTNGFLRIYIPSVRFIVPLQCANPTCHEKEWWSSREGEKYRHGYYYR